MVSLCQCSWSSVTKSCCQWSIVCWLNYCIAGCIWLFAWVLTIRSCKIFRALLSQVKEFIFMFRIFGLEIQEQCPSKQSDILGLSAFLQFGKSWDSSCRSQMEAFLVGATRVVKNQPWHGNVIRLTMVCLCASTNIQLSWLNKTFLDR